LNRVHWSSFFVNFPKLLVMVIFRHKCRHNLATDPRHLLLLLLLLLLFTKPPSQVYLIIFK
ncbi:MAG: hypothetical protein N6V49_14540, partial [Serratia symbiotica]|nr:hypothetical protein [Serratia symbiotica]